ncbi:phage portal protein [Arthrospiribacter ruber]|uniref:Phage portal protein n=1 Tax=Arthrospiribacter ruber TaxID=2487934 RepID=A0A951J0V0_9BACT|nr:phage portal protein [Arthrospiribacter ruber]MBW3469088.1 phage portal protein [Arthrospiribacter ruber]
MNIKRLFGIGKELHVPELISIEHSFEEGSATVKNALGIASFWKGVNIIANTVASLPVRLYKDKSVDKEHELYYLLKHKPNSFQNIYEFINTMILIMLTKGNSFAFIKRDEGGNIISLDIINYSTVEAVLFDSVLYFKFDGDKDKVFRNDELIHFKNVGSGFLGEDIITNFKKNLEININSTNYTNQVYTGEASSVRGTITYDKALNDTQRKRLREELATNFANRSGKRILFLEDGMKLNQISLDPTQTKFLESRTFEREEIANMLNIPVFMLTAERNTATGIESDNITFYQTTLLPIVTKIEKEFETKLLTKQEILEDNYIKISVNAILRGDSKSRAEFYKALFYLGAISPEEIRELEDMKEEINGDTYIQANLIPKNIINRFWDSKARETYSKAEMNEKELEEE